MSQDDRRGTLALLWERLRRPRQWVRYIAVAGTAFFVSLLFIVTVRPLLAPLVGGDSYGVVVAGWMLATLYVLRVYSRRALA
ncbi:hypothetical protein [Halorubrum tropicale]|uniref:DUF485 domain-containing protein n=1 Tax=Halorubrum tropicale TaxID=1765655 RepID=A0A0M9AKW5_9EURY|nr:hypothetical protein [Halorubrum tropicale]KOX92721.1 hypothetical protein AMR74_16730 [Halorubrum tropicale]